ncbi:MAG TPA: VOC family protein [Tepidiformaceae bacterium]|nr:VOC family protein [Tepidiformaceae bacterium]
MTEPVEQERAAGVEVNLARDGKVSYMQIPAADAVALGTFYEKVFGWEVGGRPGHVSFRDASGEMIGAFVSNLAPATEPGVLPYIYVQGLDAAVQRIRENGGRVVREPYPEGDLWVATFRDPAGNVMGLWQAGGR